MFSCHLSCGMKRVENDTGLMLEFFCANKNKSISACFRRAEACSQCCKCGPRKGRGEAPFKNKVFLYFDCLTLLTMEISWCTIAFFSMLGCLSKAQASKQNAAHTDGSVEDVTLRSCIVGCIWPLSTALGMTSFMWSMYFSMCFYFFLCYKGKRSRKAWPAMPILEECSTAGRLFAIRKPTFHHHVRYSLKYVNLLLNCIAKLSKLLGNCSLSSACGFPFSVNRGISGTVLVCFFYFKC